MAAATLTQWVLGQHQYTPRGPLVRESGAVLCPDHRAWTGSGLPVLNPAAVCWYQGVHGRGGPVFFLSLLLPQNYITLTCGLCCLCGEEPYKEPVGLRKRRS